MGKDFVVSTPLGEFVTVRTVYKNCVILINMIESPAELIVLLSLELDVILGRD